MEPLKILIVEDSVDDCELILRSLRKNKVNFTYSRVDTSEAMRQALRESWDIVLSDFQMPQFSGPQALQVLKETQLDIPFIIISGTIGEEIAVEMIRSGASDYLLKSSLTRLVSAIEREIEAALLRTRKREIEVALRSTEEQLRQAQKMEAIGQLAGGVAHDFNNMLSVMQLYCKKMKESRSLQESYSYVDKILNVQSRSAALTRQLLIFSRRQPCEAANLNLNEVVENMKEMLTSLVGSPIEVVYNLDRNIKNAYLNPGQLEQVVMNLAVNAKDAMPRGGHLHVVTSVVQFQKAQLVGGVELSSGEYILLEVGDTGLGMSKEVQDRIFEPFFTTKEAGHGTGLGLAIIYGIIHQSKGAISVMSAVNEGTRFQIYLPVSKVQIETAPPLAAPAEKRGGQGNILLVEDEEELRELFAEILSSEGYNVIQAGNGEEALEVLEGHGGEIDLVITDMVMPKIGGKDLYQKAKQRRSNIKFIYMSGYFADTLSESQSLLNSSYFLEKPFNEETLRSKVRSILTTH